MREGNHDNIVNFKGHQHKNPETFVKFGNPRLNLGLKTKNKVEISSF